MDSFRFLLLLSAVLLVVNGQSPLNYRPQIHFSVPQGWLNDPNGLIYHDGEYHLHYQFYPDSPTPGPRSWGHAVSTDLVTWTDIGVALSPDELGEIFSGSAVIDGENRTGFKPPNFQGDVIVAMFTHHRDETWDEVQSLAYSLDKGRTYVKYEGNPVIDNNASIIRDFRDPKVISYGNSWYTLIAAGDVIRIYTSIDLKTWYPMSAFGGEGVGSHAGVWECPDLFPLEYEGRTLWVLLVSIDASIVGGGGPNLGSATQYFIGTFDGINFTPSHTDTLWMDWGPDNYAAISFNGVEDGKVVTIGWMNNWLYARNLPTGSDGWRGQMTLPRELRLANVNGNPRLVSKPVEQVGRFFKTNIQLLQNEGVRGGSSRVIQTGTDNLLHVKVELNTFATLSDTLSEICFLNSLGQEVCVGYEKSTNRILLDRRNSGTSDFGEFNSTFYRTAYAQRELSSAIINFDIYLDSSAIEVFVDEGITCLTALFYPDAPFTRVEIRHGNSTQEGTNLLAVISAEVNSLYRMDEIIETTSSPSTTTNENNPSTSTTNSPSTTTRGPTSAGPGTASTSISMIVMIMMLYAFTF